VRKRYVGVGCARVALQRTLKTADSGRWDDIKQVTRDAGPGGIGGKKAVVQLGVQCLAGPVA